MWFSSFASSFLALNKAQDFFARVSKQGLTSSRGEGSQILWIRLWGGLSGRVSSEVLFDACLDEGSRGCRAGYHLRRRLMCV